VRRLVIGLVAAACWLAAPPARAQGQPFVRTSLDPRSVTVGQAVTLTVDVFAPGYFTGAPRFPQLEVKDAVVVFVDQGSNLNDKLKGVDYAGQRRSYLIYPQRAGTFEVPAFQVQVSYGAPGKAGPHAASAAGSRFEASIPQAARGLGYFVATPSFELKGALDRQPSGLKVGDSLTRTITMSATDAFAMMLPPLSFPAMDGIAVYPAQPKTEDGSTERGAARVARRVESVTYVLQKPGHYALPEVAIAWWDTKAKALRRASLPALAFDVADDPNRKAEIPLPQEDAAAAPPPDPWQAVRDALRRFGPLVLLALVVLAVLLRFVRAPIRALLARRAARRRAEADSADAFLGKLKAAARSGRPGELLAATYRWLDRRPVEGASAARLDRFAQQSGDPALPGLASAVVDSALGVKPAPAVEPERFVSALERAAVRARTSRADASALGPLNPR
jgi:hypothetical protein